MFPALSTAGDTQGFSVTIVDDSVVEPDEVFTLSSSDTNPRAQNLQPTAVGLISDDDGMVAYHCRLSVDSVVNFNYICRSCGWFCCI